MKAKEWTFDRQVPDSEDVIAESMAYAKFTSKPNLYQHHMNDVELQSHFFSAGFYRGMAWVIAKMKEDHREREH